MTIDLINIYLYKVAYIQREYYTYIINLKIYGTASPCRKNNYLFNGIRRFSLHFLMGIEVYAPSKIRTTLKE